MGKDFFLPFIMVALALGIFCAAALSLPEPEEFKLEELVPEKLVECTLTVPKELCQYLNCYDIKDCLSSKHYLVSPDMIDNTYQSRQEVFKLLGCDFILFGKEN